MSNEERMSIYDWIIEQGVKQGLEIVRQEKERRPVIKMLNKGYPVEEISYVLDVPVEEVLRIQAKLKNLASEDANKIAARENTTQIISFGYCK